MLLSPKYIALVLVLLAFNNVLIITPITPQFLYYGFMAFVVILAIVNSKHKIDYLTLVFVFICFLSIQFNTIPSFFKPDERFIVFVLALFVLSPLFYGAYINQVRSYCFKYTNHLIVWLTLLSFLGRVSGLYSGIDNGSNFGGFTVNSMTLSPLAGISLLLCVFNLKYKVLRKKQKVFYKLMIVISFLTMLLSASRIAIASTLIALLFLLIQFYKKRLGTLIKVLFGISILLVLSMPFWSQYTDALIEKTEVRTEEGEEFGSREELWAFRLEEFNESPIIGVGFSNSLYGTINYDTGTVEPGTSWGVILAMTGLLGMLIFIFLLLRTFIINRKKSKIKSQLSLNNFLNTLLVFFMIHWIAEGYMLAAGSYLFFYAWLVYGVSKASESHLKIDVL